MGVPKKSIRNLRFPLPWRAICVFVTGRLQSFVTLIHTPSQSQLGPRSSGVIATPDWLPTSHCYKRI